MEIILDLAYGYNALIDVNNNMLKEAHFIIFILEVLFIFIKAIAGIELY
jgi:hypothetical protein